MQLAPHVVIANKFRLVRELGRGGMGSVWLAHHTELDIPCAVKFIEGDAVHRPEMRQRFTREAKAAAQLRSPHVVQILDQGVWEETPYIAMELLDGEDLGKRLHRVGRLAPVDCVAVLGQAARALTKAHAAGIVHRDLKPDNIYLVRDDDRELVKILDFGVAKINQHALGGANATRTGTLLGTPYYMSPEQAQGTKEVDHRSDLWSLAVIAFECLTGRRPFESDALGDLLIRIVVHPAPSICSVAPDLPPTLEAWWTRASSKDPAHRYATARELVHSLAASLGVSLSGESVRPSGFGDGGRPSAFGDSGRPPAFGDSGAPIVSPFGASVAVAGRTAGRTVSPLVTSAHTPPRSSPVALIAGVALTMLVVGGGGGAWLFSRSLGASKPDATALPAPEPAGAPRSEPAVSPAASASPIVEPAPSSTASAPRSATPGANADPKRPAPAVAPPPKPAGGPPTNPKDDQAKPQDAPAKPKDAPAKARDETGF